MRNLTLLLPLLLAALAGAQATIKAPQIPDNPTGAVYDASLTKEPFFQQGNLNGNIRGSVRIEAAPNKVGVKVRVSFRNMPKDGGPFRQYSQPPKPAVA